MIDESLDNDLRVSKDTIATLSIEEGQNQVNPLI